MSIKGKNKLELNKTNQKGAYIMSGKFEVYEDKSGKFRFRLKASNGQTIATGQAYKTKKSCMNGIESVKTNAANAEIVEVEE